MSRDSKGKGWQKTVLINAGPFDDAAARQFKRQRKLLSRLAELTAKDLTAREYEDLEGLQAFCDHIADELYDGHRFKTLFGRP